MGGDGERGHVSAARGCAQTSTGVTGTTVRARTRRGWRRSGRKRPTDATVDEVDLEGVGAVLDAGTACAAQREPAPRRERAALLDGQVLVVEDVPELVGRDLGAVLVGVLLDHLGELDLQAPRQV